MPVYTCTGVFRVQRKISVIIVLILTLTQSNGKRVPKRDSVDQVHLWVCLLRVLTLPSRHYALGVWGNNYPVSNTVD